MNTNTVRGNYFQCGFVHQNEILAAFTQVLERNAFGEFDGIVCRGVSGLLVSSILANRFNLKLLVARKMGESSHDATDIAVGDYSIRKFIIVDDFVESGETILECLKCVERTKKSWTFESIHGSREDIPEMEYVGCFLYNASSCPMTRIKNRGDISNAIQCCNGKKFVTFTAYKNLLPENENQIQEFQY